MRRQGGTWGYGLVLSVVLSLHGSTAHAQEADVPFTNLEPYANKQFTKSFEAGKRITLIFIGQGTSPVALYVYDALGNCVVRDDLGMGQTRDDLIVEWVPSRTQRYTVEIRNQGPLPNRGRVFLR